MHLLPPGVFETRLTTTANVRRSLGFGKIQENVTWNSYVIIQRYNRPSWKFWSGDVCYYTPYIQNSYSSGWTRYPKGLFNRAKLNEDEMSMEASRQISLYSSRNVISGTNLKSSELLSRAVSSVSASFASNNMDGRPRSIWCSPIISPGARTCAFSDPPRCAMVLGCAGRRRDRYRETDNDIQAA